MKTKVDLSLRPLSIDAVLVGVTIVHTKDADLAELTVRFDKASKKIKFRFRPGKATKCIEAMTKSNISWQRRAS